MGQFDDLWERIHALQARASMEPPSSELAAAMEDLLAEGYICALAADARRQRLDERLEELAVGPDEPDVFEEVRRVALQRRTVDSEARALRAELARIRERVIRLRAAGLS